MTKRKGFAYPPLLQVYQGLHFRPQKPWYWNIVFEVVHVLDYSMHKTCQKHTPTKPQALVFHELMIENHNILKTPTSVQGGCLRTNTFVRKT